MIPPSARADAVAALAALVRAGMPVRRSLVVLHEHVPGATGVELRRLSRWLVLGRPLEESLEDLRDPLGPDAEALAALVAIQARLGGDLPRMLDVLARAIRERAEATEAARASGAGVRLSGRIVAALPLAFVPLSGASGGAVLDRVGLMLGAVGVLLTLCGLYWIGRLTPRPPDADDAAAQCADLVACALEGGSSLPSALDAVARRPPKLLAPSLSKARRRVALGLSWPDSLARAPEEGVRSLGERLRHAQTLGVPVAEALSLFASDRRTAKRIEFERAVRRATVLMVLPLTLCVLPAFVLLGVVPFLRSMSWG